MDNKSTFLKFKLQPQNLLAILGSIVHNWEEGGGELYDHITSWRTLHFDSEYDMHMSSESQKENGFGHDVDLSITSH